MKRIAFLTDGTFGPKKSITRAEASKVMVKGLEIIVDATLAMPKIEQPIIEWVAEDPNGTLEIRPCDGVTRRLAKTECQEIYLFLPLDGTQEWGIWGTVRFSLDEERAEKMREAMSKGLVLEDQKMGLDPRGGDVKIPYYRYKHRMIIYPEKTYFYEIYKPIN